jgi:hypothetical protein
MTSTNEYVKNGNCNKTFSLKDLMYIKVAIAIIQSNLELRDHMPETYAAMEPLKEKIDRLLHAPEVNRKD